ncbi:MAG: amidohydrolase, partial [Paraglaciecola sp.]
MKHLLFVSLILFSNFTIGAPTHISNVNGYTLNNQGDLIQFSDIVFDGGKVLVIGGNSLVKDYSDATLIDGKNKVML